MPKILIFIIVGVLLLAGGGVTIMQQMELGPFAPDPVEGAEAGAEAGDGAAKPKKPKEDESDPPLYLTLEPVVIPIFQGDKLNTNIQLTIQIEVARKDAPELRKRMTKLKDALLRDMMGFVPRHLRNHKELDIDILGRRLMVIAERAVGKGLVDGVLIQGILGRPAN
jgi:flagellar basal body-associated protein FliL